MSSSLKSKSERPVRSATGMLLDKAVEATDGRASVEERLWPACRCRRLLSSPRWRACVGFEVGGGLEEMRSITSGAMVRIGAASSHPRADGGPVAREDEGVVARRRPKSKTGDSGRLDVPCHGRRDGEGQPVAPLTRRSRAHSGLRAWLRSSAFILELEIHHPVRGHVKRINDITCRQGVSNCCMLRSLRLRKKATCSPCSQGVN